jgi:hypothetical protein
MRVGRVTIFRNPCPPAEPVGSYDERLSDLAAMLRGIPWLLAGGLAVSSTLGRYYRPHHDVDIAFPVEYFGAIEDAMRRGGYYLSTHFPISLFGFARFSISVPLRSDGWLARRRMRKLKFRDHTGRRRTPHLLGVVEALPFRVQDGCVVTCDGRHRLPLVRPLAGNRFCTLAGDEIHCLDLHYATALLPKHREPKHALDLAMIAHHFPEHVRAEGAGHEQ